MMKIRRILSTISLGPQRNPPGVHRWKTVVAYFGCEVTDGKFIYFV